jgi:hypothetical protein
MLEQDFFSYRDTCYICEKSLYTIAKFEILLIDKHTNEIELGGHLLYEHNHNTNKFVKEEIFNMFDSGNELMDNIFDIVAKTFTLSNKSFPRIGVNRIQKLIREPYQLLVPEYTLEKQCCGSDHEYSFTAETALDITNERIVFMEELLVYDYEICNTFYNDRTTISIPYEQISFDIPRKQIHSWNFNEKALQRQINNYMVLS